MANTNMINVWEQDPGLGSSPDGGLLVHVPVPNLSTPPFATKIDLTPVPPPDGYSPGTPGFRYWACAGALRRVADFWGTILGAHHWNPVIKGNVLTVKLDEGDDLNAYYDRAALNFFHAAVSGRMVYSGESPDIVCHEFGHAVLDAIRPQLWDVAAFEPPAFHESFGDMSACLSALQVQSVRIGVLQETNGGGLYRSSRLSRLAEQLGWAIRQKVPDAVEADCLRNAVNSFFYRNPDELETNAPASSLSSEPHSFSRVFTGAFFQGLALMFASGATHTEVDLQKVSVDLGKILVAAIKLSPVVPEYFAQVAGHMVTLAQRQSADYGNAIRTAMVRHGILSVPGATVVATTPLPDGAGAGGAAQPGGGATPGGGAVGVAPMAAAPPASLPTREIDVSRYGFTSQTIHVVTAGEQKRFAVSGAAPSRGDAASIKEEAAALGYFEDLIRRGRLDHRGLAKTLLVDPYVVKTHELRTEGDKVVLRRTRIDCGLRSGPTPKGT